MTVRQQQAGREPGMVWSRLELQCTVQYSTVQYSTPATAHFSDLYESCDGYRKHHNFTHGCMLYAVCWVVGGRPETKQFPARLAWPGLLVQSCHHKCQARLLPILCAVPGGFRWDSVCQTAVSLPVDTGHTGHWTTFSTTYITYDCTVGHSGF